MKLELSSDQEFFRDTTARFLSEQVPVAELRRLRDDPDGFVADYWRAGRRAGLDLAARQRGATAAARSAATAWSTSPCRPRVRTRTPRRAPGADERRGRRPERRGRSRRHAVAPRGPPGRHVDRHRGACGEPRPERPARRRRPRDPARRIGRRPERRQAPGRVGRPGRAPARHRPHRRRAHPGARAHRRRRRLDRADAHGRPHPSVLRRSTFRRRPAAGRRRGRRGRRGRRSGRTAAAARPGDRRRRVGRRHAARLRHDRRVGLRPLLVRPTARLLPGAQAPLRRHEDLARGQPRHQRRRRRRRCRDGRPTPASS